MAHTQHIPKQAPTVRAPSRQLEGVQYMPGLGVVVHEPPETRTSEQSPRSLAFPRTSEPSQYAGRFACGKEHKLL